MSGSVPTPQGGVLAPISRVEKAKRGATYVMLTALPVAMLALLIYVLQRPVLIGQSYVLSNAVRPEAMYAHLVALQRVADAHNGSRSVVHGFNASAEYVFSQLSQAGLSPWRHPFVMDWFEEVAPPALVQVAPTPSVYTVGSDFLSLSYSGSGVLTNVPLVVAAALGCDPTDFRGLSADGAAVLIKRGNCSFAQKAENALSVGALAVLIYNDGTDAGRMAAFHGTLGGPLSRPVPVLGLSFALGSALAGTPHVRITASASTVFERVHTYNVLADVVGSSGGPQVVVVGAHLDSVPAGPGINDNGSGSALVLELALQLARLHPRTTTRFAFWSAEEEGLVGSTQYVRSLNGTERARLAANLNFDMVASPNPVRGVYDGQGAPEAIRNGSVALMALFTQCLRARGQAYVAAEFNGRSDYGPFIEAGVVAGGLFTGAEVAKTAQQRQVFGGLALTPYDPCYHQPCDTLANLNMTVLAELAFCAAAVVERLAFADDVNRLLLERVSSDGGPDRSLLPSAHRASAVHVDVVPGKHAGPLEMEGKWFTERDGHVYGSRFEPQR